MPSVQKGLLERKGDVSRELYQALVQYACRGRVQRGGGAARAKEQPHFLRNASPVLSSFCGGYVVVQDPSLRVTRNLYHVSIILPCVWLHLTTLIVAVPRDTVCFVKAHSIIDPLQLHNNLFGRRPCWSTSPVSTAKNCTKVRHTYAFLLSDVFASLRRIA